jgi:purine-binding chemotaxis protein CheW
MKLTDHQERRFASFVLDSGNLIEFAIHADQVLEATPISGSIQPLPGSMSYLEGLMHLRDEAIPVINMKRRLGLPVTEYAEDAKVAVVSVSQIRLGLLFDDIRDVFVVDREEIAPVPTAFQTSEGIISNLIKLEQGRRTMELIDLKRLLGDGDEVAQMRQSEMDVTPSHAPARQTYFRFVIFSSLGQKYGVPVERVQEITFLSQIDDMFKNDVIEGAVELRGHSIPVLNASKLLQTQSQNQQADENTRVLIINAESFQYGMIVDHVHEIIAITEDDILDLPRKGHDTVYGVYQRQDGSNIILLQVDTLIETQAKELQSVARLKSTQEKEHGDGGQLQSRHLITADCYLVFSIGRNFAIELNDVQEIIETRDLLTLPASTGFDRRVLNLRGRVVPVINLHTFYGLTEENAAEDKKLIIARNGERIVALEVDRILTIYKQVQYSRTPSLNPQLSSKKDTLDRLIEFVGESGIKEHVLVINIGAMMDNHLHMTPSDPVSSTDVEIPTGTERDIKENNHDNHSKTQ